jgi:hypothetical protein
MSFEPLNENRRNGFKTRNVIVLSRGNVDMISWPKRKAKTGVPLVHTTEMKDHQAQLSRRILASEQTRIFRGPLILLPRVGNPRKDKIILYESSRRIAVSSCVLTISCEGKAVARLVYKLLISNWRKVEKQYMGTCARYMTLERLLVLLADFGYHAELSPCVLNQSSKVQRYKSLELGQLADGFTLGVDERLLVTLRAPALGHLPTGRQLGLGVQFKATERSLPKNLRNGAFEPITNLFQSRKSNILLTQFQAM